MTDRSGTRERRGRTEGNELGREWADHAQQLLGWSVHGTSAEDRMIELDTLLIVADQCFFFPETHCFPKATSCAIRLTFYF